MPIHDWTRVPSGLYHHFHQQWTGEICNALNAGPLPSGYYALVDQRAIGLIPDVLAVAATPTKGRYPNGSAGGVMTLEAPAKSRFILRQSDREIYAARANRVAVRNPMGEVVAMIELVSPGNQDSRRAIDAFAEKSADFLARGVHLLVIDLFPPTPRDPQGIHPPIWADIDDGEEPFALPADKPLTVAAYDAGPPRAAYVEPVAVGDALPDMALFLVPGRYIPAPLEASYTATWAKCPEPLREMLDAA